MSDDTPQRTPLRKVGGLWKPKPGLKSLGSGSITVGRLKQKFVIVTNDRKEPGSAQPDYLLMTSSEPEADAYQARTPEAPAATSDPF